jgi:uncharacterized protein YecE (DUF72 family)
MAWEPRGAWAPELVHELCAAHDLIHCVDPFLDRSVYGEAIYCRLHGIGSYSYRYTDADLRRLKTILAGSRRDQPAYVLFNNMPMKDDAQRFMRLLNDGSAAEDPASSVN